MNSHFKISTFLLLISTISFQSTLIAGEYRGAEYRTKEAYLYGRFEVRMKSAHREGMLSSFFTYWDGGDGIWNEIDIEVMGRYGDNIQFNTITPGQSYNHVGHYPMKNSPHLDYHVYAFEWTPQYVAWFVDGNEVLKQTHEHIQTLTKPQKIMMNVWPPQYENWAGVLDPLTLPAFAYYDWVKYYSYTSGSGNYGTGNNFTHSWTDNFDSWDTTRWDKATHTFGGNNANFIKENAVFNDGKLILCLTTSTDIGYTDVTPPSILYARASPNKVTVVFSEEVDQAAAEDITKYFINGVTIISASLLTDLKTVNLEVSGLTIPSTNNLIVLSMKDRAPIPNIAGAKLKSIIMPQALTFPIKINCGGYSELGYLPDTSFSKDTEYGYLDGTSAIYPSSLPISGTNEDAIFQSDRYGLVGYKVRVPNGNYDVKMFFSEKYFSTAGSRRFDVYLELNPEIINLDIYGQVGKNAACIKEIKNISVNDGALDIHLADKIDNALISGIIITPSTTGLRDDEENMIEDFKVEQNYPNPFNGKTIINYFLNTSDNVGFQLFNIVGEQIFSEDLGFVQGGSHKYLLDTEDINERTLSSGVYFYVFTTSQKRETHKLVLLN
jgi:hypothetical protein